MADTAKCPQCERPVLQSHYTESRCPVCIRFDRPEPDVLKGKRSPLFLGIISVLCDPTFLTSVLAILSARHVLRAVRRREDSGMHHPAHARLRSGAVWGVFLALVRPLGLAFFGLGIATIPSSPTPAEYPESEWAEIRSDLLATGERLERGWCDLAERGLSGNELRFVLSHLPPPGELDRCVVIALTPRCP